MLKLKLKNKIAVAFSILFIFLTFTPVYADWTLTDQTGDWRVCERTRWSKYETWADGEASWEINVTNFDGYYAEISMSTFYCSKLEWWRFSAGQNVELIWVLSNGSHFIRCGFLFMHWFEFWGAIWHGPHVYGGWCGTFNDTDPLTTTIHPVELDENTVIRLYVYFTNETINNQTYQVLTGKMIANVYGTEYDIGGVIAGDISQFRGIGYPVDIQQWRNLTITFQIKHGGVGKFDGQMWDSIETTWTREVPTGVKQWLTSNPIEDFINTIVTMKWAPEWVKELFAFVAQGISLIGNAVIGFVPFIPIILLFWLLDAALTSAYYGELHPLGSAIMNLYDIFRGLIQTLYNILHFLYDAFNALFEKLIGG